MLSQSSVILETVSELAQGGTILYPTDTIWGLGCDATNADAVEKIYSIKQRDHSKSMLILCSDIDMVERYVAPVSDKVGELLLGSDRPTTVIMPLCKSLLANNLAAADGTVGVRIPKMDFCQQLLRTFERPPVWLPVSGLVCRNRRKFKTGCRPLCLSVDGGAFWRQFVANSKAATRRQHFGSA